MAGGCMSHLRPLACPLRRKRFPSCLISSSLCRSLSNSPACIRAFEGIRYQILLSRRAELTNRRFKVMDDERLSDDLAAWACFRLDRLRPGLRILHLYDSNGVITKGVLLVRIAKTVSRL
jgi:hypothetical protein